MRLRVLFFIFVLFLSSSAFAQQNGFEKRERYYNGIGVNFFVVSENTKSFFGDRNGQLIEFSNESGEFTGSVIIGSILPKGSASKAGLTNGDMLLEVDHIQVGGRGMAGIGMDGAIKAITSKSVGKTVILTVGQTDEIGKMIRTFDVPITIETIDRVDWIPLDLELGGSYCEGSECIEYTTIVSEDKNTGIFKYRYEITNMTSKSIILESSLLNLLFRKNILDPARYLLKIDSLHSSAFILTSDDFPIEGAPAMTRYFRKAEDDLRLAQYFKENYPNTSSEEHYYLDGDSKLWLNYAGAGNYYFVPESWYEIMYEYYEKFWSR